MIEYLVVSGTDDMGNLVVEWSGPDLRLASVWVADHPGWELYQLDDREELSKLIPAP